MISDDNGMADILSKQYSSVFSPALSDEYYDNFLSQRIAHLNVVDIMPKIEFNSEMLWTSIKNMKSYASPGPDGVSGCCLKFGGQFVEDALLDIFADSVEMELAPKHTRISWICPVWKGDSKMIPANHRPIALTSQVSKFF